MFGRQRRWNKKFTQGYNYAAGELLRSQCVADTITHLWELASHPFDSHPHDRGIRQALNDHSRRTRKPQWT